MKTLLALLTVLAGQFASASFLDSCQLDGTISSIEPVKTMVDKSGQQKMVRPMTLKVKSVVDKGGHTDCTYHIDREIPLDLESKSLESLVSLNQGYYVSVDYFHVNGLTPDGVISYTNATIIDGAKKAFDALMVDAQVTAKIAEIYENLSVTDQPVVLLKSMVHLLPEGICGFVGCSSTHLVTLTYGQQGYNAPTETIVAKVTQGPLGDSVSVQILK